MNTQLFYILPQQLFESINFQKNDLKVYGRIRMLPDGLTTTRKKLGQMIDMPTVSVKRSISKLLKAGWLIELEGVIKTLDHLTISRLQGITDDTLSGKKGSRMIPKGITDDTLEGITDDTSHNIYIYKKKIKESELKSSPTLTELNPRLIYVRVSEDPDEPRSKYVRMSEAEVLKLRDKIDELDLWPALNSKQALYDLFLSMDVYVSKNPKKNAPENYYRMALNWINREKKGTKKCQAK